MSARFDLVVIRAPLLKLWVCTALSVFFASCWLLCCSQQRSKGFPSTSMRLRLKRTCSGVECFGDFHIHQFLNLFLFLKGPNI